MNYAVIQQQSLLNFDNKMASAPTPPFRNGFYLFSVWRAEVCRSALSDTSWHLSQRERHPTLHMFSATHPKGLEGVGDKVPHKRKTPLPLGGGAGSRGKSQLFQSGNRFFYLRHFLLSLGELCALVLDLLSRSLRQESLIVQLSV